jgi:hypothetical protein
MSTYKFVYRRKLLWKSLKATGHRLDKELNRMDIFHEDGSITSLSQWSKYDLKLGTDWVLFTKKQMEKESGQDVKLAVGE